MKFSRLEHITNGTIYLKEDHILQTFSTDCRIMSGGKNEVFIAIQTKNGDGMEYVKNAYDKGVRNFILNRDVSIDANRIVVEDTVDAFQRIAAHHRSMFDIPIIGITGSNGKTIVKEWLSSILSKELHVVKSPKSYNSQIGVPLSVLELKPYHQVGIFEAGISQCEEMTKLQKIIQPTMGIFTFLGDAHEKGFGDKREKLQEKLFLFQNCDQIICRSDTSWFPTIENQIGKEKLVSWSLDSSISSNYHIRMEKDRVYVNHRSFRTKLKGGASRENLVHCIIAALELGIAEESIQESVKILRDLPMRLILKKAINGCYLLDDSYNNDITALKVALEYMGSQNKKLKRTVILSDILETKSKPEELYKEVSKYLIQNNVTRMIGIGKHIASIATHFPHQILFFSTVEELIQKLPTFKHELILVKGARFFQLEKLIKTLEEKSHDTVLEINFEKLKHNLNQYRNLLNGDTQIMVMIKANAYGSGLLELAGFFQHHGVDRLGVAFVDEAIELRKNNIELPIMIMNPNIRGFYQFEKYHLEAVIYSVFHLQRFIKETKKIEKIPIHLKLDTGMHRLGFMPTDLELLFELLKKHPQLRIKSIFSHFSGAEEAHLDHFTLHQVNTFNAMYDKITKFLGYQPGRHICNSAGTIRQKEYHYEMVRLGIGLYGIDNTNTLNLQPIGTFRTNISQLKSLNPGDKVGYSCEGNINQFTKLAILPVGYADGYARAFGNGSAKVSVNGYLCPTIGNICMDMMMVDVTNIEVSEGDEVVLFGQDPSLNELAKIANMIPYELLTSIPTRVKRLFLSE